MAKRMIDNQIGNYCSHHENLTNRFQMSSHWNVQYILQKYQWRLQDTKISPSKQICFEGVLAFQKFVTSQFWESILELPKNLTILM